MPRLLLSATAALTAGLVLFGASPTLDASASLDRAGAPAAPKALLFVSAAGSDASRCTQAAPCQTFQRAYALATRGAIVTVQPGDYPAVALAPDHARRTGTVVFVPAAPGSVSTAGLSIQASGVEIRGITVRGWINVMNGPLNPEQSNVTLRGVTGNGFAIAGRVRHIRILGGSFGPAVNGHPTVSPYDPGDSVAPQDVRIEGVRLHDFTRANETVHTECLQVWGGANVAIRRNKFSNCDGTADLAVSRDGAFPTHHIVVENNWFDDRGDAYYAVQASLAVDDLAFRYNSFKSKGIAINGCPDCHGRFSFVGNLMPKPQCVSDATFKSNVFIGGRCSATDTSAKSFGYVDAANFDLRLRPGAAAIGRGSRTDHPPDDIDGRLRPRSHIDAGGTVFELADH